MSDIDPNPPLEPPKPRKQPKQTRSRILVESIKQSCLMILEESGPQGLTVTRISEISGVAMGSIYQYFPNIDSIIATLYEDQIEADILIAHEKVRGGYQNKSLEASLSSLIRGTLSFHSRMLKLDQDFHRRFYHTFDLTRWYNQRAGDPHASGRALQNILETHKEEYPFRNPAMEAMILDSAFKGTILDAVKYHPEYIDDPEFAEILLRLGTGVLGLPTPA
jgi:AcrR family transcriptional regulator